MIHINSEIEKAIPTDDFDDTCTVIVWALRPFAGKVEQYLEDGRHTEAATEYGMLESAYWKRKY